MAPWSIQARARRRAGAFAHGVRARRRLMPLVSVALVAGAAALASASMPMSSVGIDGTRVVSVVSGSVDWEMGVRPGWSVAADGTSGGTRTFVTDGTSVVPVNEDPLGPHPLDDLAVSGVIVALATLTLLVGAGASSNALFGIAAASAGSVFVGRLGPLGAPLVAAPIGLAAFELAAILERRGRSLALASWAVGSIGVLAGLLVGADASSIDTVVLATTIIILAAVVAVAVRRARRTASARGVRGRRGILRAVVAELSPFAGSLRSDAARAERERLAGDLHAQVIPALAFAANELERAADPVAAARLRELALDVRDLMNARRLPILEDEGLVAALEWLAEAVEEHSSLKISIDLAAWDGSRAPAPVERAAYRVIQLALDNVIRHAHARTVRLAVAGGAQALELEVVDDGAGIALTDAPRAARAGHLGLADMRSEAEAVGASLQIHRLGDAGTEVRFGWAA